MVAALFGAMASCVGLMPFFQCVLLLMVFGKYAHSKKRIWLHLLMIVHSPQLLQYADGGYPLKKASFALFFPILVRLTFIVASDAISSSIKPFLHARPV